MSPNETLSLSAEAVSEQRLNMLRCERELWHVAHDNWPSEPLSELEGALVSELDRDGEYRAVIERGDGIVRVTARGGAVHVNCYAGSEKGARRLLAIVREEIPRAESKDPDIVPVTFWALSPHGPQAVRRQIDAPAWETIKPNYPGGGELGALLGDWTPGVGGQLLLWHGEAGTGKTTALRSLGREWRKWAELHYIVDPEKFFGESASYMLSVMMGHDGELNEGGELPWRLLILEDCGELLAPDAKQQVGQNLSRLLNACDGLIGRGLRLLILVTTNEPLEKVHPAIARPGRCAARIEFARFNHQQAVAWLGEHDCEPVAAASHTLADLYALRDGYRNEPVKPPLGFAVA